MNYKYTVIFEPAEEGGYIAHVPALEDLTTEGDTLEEVKIMVEDAIKGYLEVLQKHSLPIPIEKSDQKPFIEELAVST